jgi:hypothetical protein
MRATLSGGRVQAVVRRGVEGIRLLRKEWGTRKP